MVGGNRKSANERLRLADWPWPVERRLRRGVRVRAVDCTAAPATAAWLAQRLGEYVALGAQDPTAKRRVFHAAQVLAAHGVGSQSREVLVASCFSEKFFRSRVRCAREILIGKKNF